MRARVCKAEEEGRSFCPGLSNAPFIYRTETAHWQPKVIISMLRGSLKPQLSAQRPEAGGVSLTAVSLCSAHENSSLSPLYTEVWLMGYSGALG